jgi:hypothetical protein
MSSSDHTLSNCQCNEGYIYLSGMCQVVCPIGEERVDAYTCQKILTCDE